MDLCIPKAALSVNLAVFGEIGDKQDGIVSDFCFIDSEFEVFIIVLVFPAEANLVIFFSADEFGNFGFSVPGKVKGITIIIYRIGEPLLEPGCGNEAVVKDQRTRFYDVFYCELFLFRHVTESLTWVWL